jgi:hypothetical protein
VFLDNNFFIAQTIFYTDYQDFFTFVLHHSPELVFALNDYFTSYYWGPTVYVTPSITFDVYNDNLGTSISEFLEYFLLFFIFT